MRRMTLTLPSKLGDPIAPRHADFQVTFRALPQRAHLQSLGTQDSSCSHWPMARYFPSSVLPKTDVL